MSDDTNTEARFWRLTGQLSGALRRKWAAYDSVRRIPVDGGLILVDLTVDDPQFALSKLLIGKYLSWLLRGEMCAVAYGDARSLPSASADFATAFGCNRVVGLGDAVGQMMAQTPDLRSVVLPLVKGWPLEGEGLRRALLGLTIDGLPVGDLVYDTYLRTGGVATVERLDDRLGGLIADAFLRVRAYNKLFDQHKIRAVIAGHMVYNYFGILSRVAISRGVDVYLDGATNPMKIRRYSDPLMMRQHLYEASALDIDHILRTEKEEAVDFANRYATERRQGRIELGYMDNMHGPYGSNRRMYEKQAFCRNMGWDGGTPIICLMSHVMYESPHAVDGGVFYDILDWLKKTLAFADQRQDVQWLLKTHPAQENFDKTLGKNTPKHHLVEDLMGPYKEKKHISICPEDINTSSLVDIVDGIITQHGTAGYEFPIYGVPAVLASKSYYANLGFAPHPINSENYFNLIDRMIDFPEITEMEVLRAQAFVYFHHEKSRINTILLPEMRIKGCWAPNRDPSFLSEVLDLVEVFHPEDDPLYYGIKKMISQDDVIIRR